MTERWTKFEGPDGGAPIEDESPSCVIVCTDLSPRELARSGEPRRIDRDDLDALLARLAPRLDLGLPEFGSLTFSCWDDFTPLGIALQSRPLRRLLEARESGTLDAELRGLLGDEQRVPAAYEAPAANRSADGAALLDALLGEPAPESVPVARARGVGRDAAFDRVVQEIADRAASSQPHGPSPELRARINAELARRLVLARSHPALLSLEAAWASLRRLVRNLETSDALRLRVIDVARGDCAAAIARVAAAPPEGERVRLVVACFAYESSESDGAALAALARAAESLGAVALADATPELLARAASGELGQDAAWRELSAQLRGRLWLAGPRVLARAPHGAESEGAEGLGLDGSDTGAACWTGAASVAAEALLAGTAQIDWLPTFASAVDGEPIQVGPTEVRLSEREIERATGAGLVVVAGVKGADFAIVRGGPRLGSA